MRTASCTSKKETSSPPPIGRSIRRCGSDLDRRRHQAVSVVGHPRISGREVSGAAAITSRCAGAGLGARNRLDQCGRLAPADRAPGSALSDGRAEGQRLAWIQHWLGAGLQAIETLLAEHSSSGVFCHGDRPTIADICLVTQVTPAKTFDLALDPYPRVMRIYENCMAIPAFADAHPSKQPDAE